MKHTQEEILNALRVIKDTCKEFDNDGILDCPNCPFGNLSGDCILNEKYPLEWNISSEEIWRAFE